MPSIGLTRIRLEFDPPLCVRPTWFDTSTLTPSSTATIAHLTSTLYTVFQLSEKAPHGIELELDGFLLMPSGLISSLLKNDELVKVKAVARGHPEKRQKLDGTGTSQSTLVSSESSSDSSSSSASSTSSESDSESDSSEEESPMPMPVRSRPVPSPSHASSSATLALSTTKSKLAIDIEPPLSLGGRKRKQIAQMLRMSSSHVRFEPNPAPSPPEPTPVSVKSREPKVTFTEARLYDGQATVRQQIAQDALEYEGGSTPTGKKRNRRRQRKRAGAATIPSDPSVPGPSFNASTQEALENSHESRGTQEAYTKYPKLQGIPCVGAKIAFKELEMGPDYSPIVSNHKVATVVNAMDTGSGVSVTLQLAAPSTRPAHYDADGNRLYGKFELPLDHDPEDTTVTKALGDLMDVRLVA